MTSYEPDALTLARGGAQTAVAVARRRGFDIPSAYIHAEACHAEATRLVDQPEPTFLDLPDDPTKLPAAIRKAATERSTHTAVIEMATAAAANASAAMSMHHRAALPGFVEQLAHLFAEAAATFTQARATAPDKIGAYTDDSAISAYVSGQKSVIALDALAGDRMLLGSTIAEPGLHQSTPWHVLTVPNADDAQRIDYLRDLLAEMRTRAWQERDAWSRWSSLAAAGHLNMADLGTVNARIEQWQRVQSGSAGDLLMTPLGQRMAEEARAKRALATR